MPAVDLAVIIVTWNTRQLVLEAINSLLIDLEDCGVSAGVHVVDCAFTAWYSTSYPRTLPYGDSLTLALPTWALQGGTTSRYER
ncbi:MAG UNVERIFIED_CONTAM: hypothetical protein LVT10_03805 [Anaerolineae bacterium]|jgi:hypothetical protein